MIAGMIRGTMNARPMWLLAAALACRGTAYGQLTTDQLLDTLQHTSFNYFWNEANSSNGLIKDRSASGAPCSIASLGFGLTALCIGADHGWVTRAAARDRVRAALGTLWSGPQGTAAAGTNGYKGFYYHFLDMSSAVRTWSSELSTIDSGLLFAGILYVREYFNGADSTEMQIRALADSIYYRADWEWFRNFNPGLLMGWMPGTQFAGYGQWAGYNEAMIMYILGYGSPTHPISDQYGWQEWTGGYTYATEYGYSYVVFPPLFGHQYSHCWIDFRNIRDAYTRNRGFDYFENSRRATLAQRAYCAANPGGFSGYSDTLWGITASDAPSGYSARGAPPAQGDDGTLVPTAPISSLPFAPAEVFPAIWNMWNNYRPQLWTGYGFRDAFNLGQNWFGPDEIGIDQGPIIIMIENYRNGGVWSRFMQNADVQRGLERAGFQPVTSVDDGKQRLPSDFELEQNYPNPFNPVTDISFRIPSGKEGPVRLTVYDLLGREVAVIVNEELRAGEYSRSWNASGISSGVYFCRLTAPGTSLSRKLVLVQ